MKEFFAAIIFFSAAAASSQVQQGLVAEFNFNDGTVKDAADHHRVKAVGASFVEDRFGNPMKSAYLTGAPGSYLNLGTSNDLKPRNGSLSLWVEIDIPIEAGTGYHMNPIILTKSRSGDDFFEAYAVYYNYKTGKIHAGTTFDSTTQVGITSASRFKLNRWNHIVMAFNDDSLWLYLNGVKQNTIAKKFRTIYLQGDSVMIGNSANTKNMRFLMAAVDDIKIYNRVLSQSEVLGLYDAPDPNRMHIIIRNIAIGLGVIVVVLFSSWAITYRYRLALRKEIEKRKLQSQIFETEIRAVKAQMNPHFIFNSLNSIQQFILNNDNDNAYKYLVKFSKLVRKLLESSTAENIMLEEEIDILKRYLEIESLRFEDAFDYEVKVDERLNPAIIKIPHMLIQPFVENAIWHGLLHKHGDKKLSVSFSYLDKNRLSCIVDDNGVGRKEQVQAEKKEERRSLATELIGQRLKLIKEIKHIEGGLKIDDKPGRSGTTVTITIPVLNNYEHA
jgi:two-component sensor histidine kinase